MKTGFVFMVVLVVFTLVTVLLAGCAVPQTPTPAPAPAAGAQPPGPVVSTGTIEVRVTDAPPRDEVTSIMVTVSTVEIHKAAAEQEEGEQNQEEEPEQGREGWLPLTNILLNTFDLLQIKGLEEVLATNEVGVGKYTQIRMVIEKVEVTLGDGQPQEATLSSGRLKFVRPFEVIEGKTTVLLLDFNADKSVTVTGQGKVLVKPVVKLTIQQGKPHQLASIEGTISQVDSEAATLSIVPTGATEPVVLDVNRQTEIALDGEEATLDDLAGLAEGNSVTAAYYIDTFKAVEIDARSP